MAVFQGVFSGKTVFLTGHTGFKGAWLAFWLQGMRARVIGFSLEPPTNPSLFQCLGLEPLVEHHIGDIRDLPSLRTCINSANPDFVFHLAAQPLVRLSYEEPLMTYETNVMGTAHVLECLRSLTKPCTAVMITTDKCYENQEWLFGYREQDPLGGHDPYSSSKAAAEIVIGAYRRSFFQKASVGIASARAGNVIGGGDWAKDRIVPDCIRALEEKIPIIVRNKTATRPWQHVLEPLSGYLWLAAKLHQATPNSESSRKFASAFNFGPDLHSNRTVEELVKEILKWAPGTWIDKSDPNALHEANLLHLSIEKAFKILGWLPVWDFPLAIQETVQWHLEVQKNPSFQAVRSLTQSQIDRFVARAQALEVQWALS